MSYREQAQRSRSPLRRLSWALVAIGAALLVFITWHQIAMNSVSRRYGIVVPWLSQILWLVAFVVLQSGACYAARKRQYSVSVGLSSFVVSLLGIGALFIVAQIGMLADVRFPPIAANELAGKITLPSLPRDEWPRHKKQHADDNLHAASALCCQEQKQASDQWCEQEEAQVLRGD